MLPNISLMLTRLAGEIAVALGLPRCARMGRAMPEPPSGLARGRWAATTPRDVPFVDSNPGIRF
jgi:hypothetical protein